MNDGLWRDKVRMGEGMVFMGRVGGMFTSWGSAGSGSRFLAGLAGRVGESDGSYTLLLEVGYTFTKDRIAGLALLLKNGKHGCAITFGTLDTTTFSFRQSKYSSAVNGQGAAPPS